MTPSSVPVPVPDPVPVFFRKGQWAAARGSKKAKDGNGKGNGNGNGREGAKLALPPGRALGYSAARLAVGDGAGPPTDGRAAVPRRRAPRRAGVAKQWRIRHKLMLGLALAVAILALILGGTVRAVWAYW